MPSVLFVCTANQFRSPLAAASFLKLLEDERTGENWVIESAGTWTKDHLPAAGIALQAARQFGVVGLSRHRTRQISQDLLDQCDLIIVMEMGQKEAISAEFPSVQQRLFLLSEIVEGLAYDIPDPSEHGVYANDVARELTRLIIRGKEKILQLAKSLARLRTP